MAINITRKSTQGDKNDTGQKANSNFVFMNFSFLLTHFSLSLFFFLDKVNIT